MTKDYIHEAKEKFAAIVEEQLARIERMKEKEEKTDFSALKPIIIGSCWGDGIGEAISKHAQHVLEHILKDEIAAGGIVIRDIAGLTIENRVKKNAAIPDDVLEELKACHVILKGPTTTPQAGDAWPNCQPNPQAACIPPRATVKHPKVNMRAKPRILIFVSQNTLKHTLECRILIAVLLNCCA